MCIAEAWFLVLASGLALVVGISCSFDNISQSDFAEGERSIMEGNEPQHVPSDTNQSIRRQLSGEAPCIIKIFKDEGCEVEEILVCVVEPCPTGECEDTRLILDRDADEANRTCAKESGPRCLT